MNRREILITALAAPVLAMPFSALAASPRITWMPGALQSRHALLVARHLNQLIRDKVLYTTGEMSSFGYSIKLLDPKFVVWIDGIMWHPTRGYRYDDNGLRVEIHEQGLRLGDVGLFSMADYESYFGTPKPPQYRDFGLRAFHTPYQNRPRECLLIRGADWEVVERRMALPCMTITEIEQVLGRNRVGVDTRGLEQWSAALKAKNQNVITGSIRIHEDDLKELMA